MILSPKKRKAFIFFWAASICWIYIGLLVNFHQHRIWGRQLIPQFYFYKRGVDKPYKTWSLSKNAKDKSSDTFDHFDFTFIPSSTANSVLTVTVDAVLPAFDPPQLPGTHFISHGLRAPPVA